MHDGKWQNVGKKNEREEILAPDRCELLAPWKMNFSYEISTVKNGERKIKIDSEEFLLSLAVNQPFI